MLIRILLTLSMIFSSHAVSATPLPAIGSHTQFHPPPQAIKSLIQRFDRKLPEMMRQLGTPGAAIAIVYKGNIVYLKPYGFKHFGRRDLINNETLFQLGSVSKPFSAALATTLAQNAHFKLDDRVDAHLPHFKQAKFAFGRTTPLRIRNLLSHTSGIPRAGFNRLIESHLPYSKILSRLRLTPQQCLIGTCYDYHNVAFSLIGDVVQAATNTSYEKALNHYLLKPLNMNRTSANLQALLLDNNKAYPHVKNKKGRTVACTKFSKGYYAVAPSGGINSSVRDMAIFLQAQLGKYPLVLRQAAIDEMTTPHIETPEMLSRLNHSEVSSAHYGLGWRILNFAQTKLVFHGGWLKGFSNVIAFMPDHEIGIVILQNAETRFSWAATAKFFEYYLELPESETNYLVKKKTPNLRLIKSNRLVADPIEILTKRF